MWGGASSLSLSSQDAVAGSHPEKYSSLIAERQLLNNIYVRDGSYARSLIVARVSYR